MSWTSRPCGAQRIRKGSVRRERTVMEFIVDVYMFRFGLCLGLAWNDWVWLCSFVWVWHGMSETGWRMVLYVAFRMELKDLCHLKGTKQTSVNNEPTSFSSEALNI